MLFFQFQRKRCIAQHPPVSPQRPERQPFKAVDSMIYQRIQLQMLLPKTYAKTMTVNIWSSNLHQWRLHKTVEIWACKCTVVLSLGVLFCFAGLRCNPTTTASPEKYHGGRQILFESFEFQGGCF